MASGSHIAYINDDKWCRCVKNSLLINHKYAMLVFQLKEDGVKSVKRDIGPAYPLAYDPLPQVL